MNEVAEKIIQEIASRGPISFARFMELALYCPVYGYYEGEKDTLGKRGDYYTSVSTGSLFGNLLAAQFAEWLSWSPKVRAGAPAHLVEAGAHDGRLAGDILSWLQMHRPGLFQDLRYFILEPSSRRRDWQRQTLGALAEKVTWLNGFSEFDDPHMAGVGPSAQIEGIMFSNEFLDAFPFHRCAWDAQQRRWLEWGVTMSNGGFAWERLEAQSPVQGLEHISGELLDRLPHGFVMERCPAAEEWCRTAARRLAWGKLVTIDYGQTTAEMLGKKDGTLRAYYRHRVTDDVLAHPGRQDITATVNWDLIQAAGEAAGLKTETLVSQEEFLTRIAAKAWELPESFGPWSDERTRQFRTLTHPEHLGRRFRVLVQGRE